MIASFLALAVAVAVSPPPDSPALPEPASAGTAAPAQVSGKRIRQIREAIDAGRFVQADEMLGMVSPDAPVDMLLLAGRLRHAQNRAAEALAFFQRAEIRSPENARAIGGSGIALLTLGRTAEAEAKLRKATELEDKDWRAWNALGVALDRRGDWPGSHFAYERALRQAPGQAQIHNNLGYSLLLQRRLDEACAQFAKALVLSPDDPKIHLNLELAEGMAGKTLSRAPKESPRNWAKRLNNAGYAAMLAGDLARARSLLAQAIAASDTRYEIAERNLARIDKATSR